MTEADVEQILGKGTPLSATEVEEAIKQIVAGIKATDGAAKPKLDSDLGDKKGTCWGAGSKTITVLYRAGRVYKIDANGL